MRQYQEVKREHPDKILFFHLGDFYETFHEDAVTTSRVLGLTLTSREKGPGAIPMAGLPVRSATTYISRMLAAGYKVALCDQVEEAAQARGLVRRAVTRVITPGTILEEALLERGRNNYLTALALAGERCGLAAADLSTGEFLLLEVERRELAEELSRLNPAEYLLPEGLVADEAAPPYGRNIETDGASVTKYPDWAYDYQAARRKMLAHFGVTSLEAFGCEKLELAVSAAGVLLRYLEETQKEAPRQIKRPVVLRSSEYLELDRTTLANLEILESARERERAGSLLAVLDRTETAMGARLLRNWLIRPLLRIAEIVRRQEAIQELLERPESCERVARSLRGMADMERLTSRVASKRAGARELASLRDSLSRLPELASLIADAESALLAEAAPPLGALGPLVRMLAEALMDSPAPTPQEGGLIRPGADAELDRLREIQSRGRSWIAELQALESRRTGISPLKVGYNQVFGYYLEVTRSNLKLVPPHYIRKQTLKDAERFVTPELKERENELLSAQERIVKREYELFVELRERAAGYTEHLQAAAASVALLDTLASLAAVARERHYTRPRLEESGRIAIRDGRHPVLETVLPRGEFVPNDTELSREESQLLIITGPNMAGKSTYLRQVALLVLMAQMGSFVPAREAEIGLVDRLYTRVGTTDDLSRGRSTFMVEMLETASILHQATPRSLVVLDEVGRGTSTFDGVAIAWATAEHLCQASERPRTLFATHYHELTQLASALPRVKNYHLAVREWEGEITFLRKILPGASDRSYGIYVARLAGLPPAVVARARELLARLEAGTGAMPPDAELPLFAPRPAPEAPAEKPPPGALERVARELAELSTDELTPLEALNRLAELAARARELAGRKGG